MDYAFKTRNSLFFVLEYCSGGELYYYLKRLLKFKMNTTKFYASNILLGLKTLH